MTTAISDDAGYDPGVDRMLHDSRGNPIDSDYIDKVSLEAEIGYALEELAPVRVGRPSLSEAGDSPQIRFRLPADTVPRQRHLPLVRERLSPSSPVTPSRPT